MKCCEQCGASLEAFSSLKRFCTACTRERNKAFSREARKMRKEYESYTADDRDFYKYVDKRNRKQRICIGKSCMDKPKHERVFLSSDVGNRLCSVCTKAAERANGGFD
jgi:hypothetical protein